MRDDSVAKAPIFVVGASRSGTSLMRACLNKHPDVHLVGETHYFDDLRVRMAEKATSALGPADAEACEDYFLAITHRPYGHGGVASEGTMVREDLVRRARGVGFGADALFEAFCRMQAEAKGASRWGEKTPRHVYRIDDIIRRYPDAQIIVMVRDPRSVIASYRDWRHHGGFDLQRDPEHAAALERDEVRAKDSYHVVTQTLLWRSTVNSARRSRERFGAGRVHVQRYEDLVERPVDSLAGICEWLGIGYLPEMVDVPVHNSSFTTFDKGSGISAEPMKRWRQKLSDDEVALIQAVGGRLMRAHGYARERVRPSARGLAGACVGIPRVVLRGLRANRDRLGEAIPAYVWRRLRTAFAG